MDRPDRFNIPGDAYLSNEELVYRIANEMRAPVTVQFEDFHKTRPGHDRHYGLSGAKLFSAGWKSPMSFEEGLRRTVRFQEEHPEWLKLK